MTAHHGKSEEFNNDNEHSKNVHAHSAGHSKHSGEANNAEQETAAKHGHGHGHKTHKETPSVEAVPVENDEDIDNVDAGDAQTTSSSQETPATVTVEAKLAQMAGEIVAAQDKFLRLQAEYQNYRKRVLKDIAVAKSIVLEDTIMPFLQVFDYLNMAFDAAANSDNIASIREGLKMIMNEYQKAMDELGVQKINALDQTFDPAMHEALAHESSEKPEGKVIKQWNYGYKLNEKLLRPAKVVVSSGPDKKTDKE